MNVIQTLKENRSIFVLSLIFMLLGVPFQYVPPHDVYDTTTYPPIIGPIGFSLAAVNFNLIVVFEIISGYATFIILLSFILLNLAAAFTIVTLYRKIKGRTQK